MENIEIYKASSADQIRSCYKVMRQLHPNLTDEQQFVERVQRQRAEGYQLAYCLDGEEVQGLIGFRFLEFLAWGKVMYIDDLVTDSGARKSGRGSQLLKWVIGQAKHAKCDEVHLDTGPQHNDAHRLYLNCGFKIIGFHLTLDLKSVGNECK